MLLTISYLVPEPDIAKGDDRVKVFGAFYWERWWRWHKVSFTDHSVLEYHLKQHLWRTVMLTLCKYILANESIIFGHVGNGVQQVGPLKTKHFQLIPSSCRILFVLFLIPFLEVSRQIDPLWLFKYLAFLYLAARLLEAIDMLSRTKCYPVQTSIFWSSKTIKRKQRRKSEVFSTCATDFSSYWSTS